MAKEVPSTEISGLPELSRLAEEVRDSNTPRVLRRGNEVVATIVPPTPPQAKQTTHQRRRRNIEADLAAIRASAGSWRGLVDAAQLKKEIREARGSDRPDVTL